jgi:XTP/dITP diphosphohydrolase
MDLSRILVATTNAGKLREVRAALEEVPVVLDTLDSLPPIPEPEETGSTFAENARLKARYYAARSGRMTVAEDSGLEIDALGGEPGVRSARFLGPDASYAQRFAEIERRLQAHPLAPRTARFVCAAVVASPEHALFETTGTVEGIIAPAPAGEHGFGYDPIFYYPPYAMTFGEISRDAKNRVSHRGVAFRRVAGWLLRPSAA